MHQAAAWLSRRWNWSGKSMRGVCREGPRFCVLLNNSLIESVFSLFFEKFSLLICLGNLAKSHCSGVVSSYDISSGSLKIAEFPVKFPVSREFAWRRVRSALRRQGGSLVRTRTFRFVIREAFRSTNAQHYIARAKAACFGLAENQPLERPLSGHKRSFAGKRCYAADWVGQQFTSGECLAGRRH
jgi:hypothetical protein